MEKCKIAHFCTSSEPHLQIRGVQAPEDGATSAAGGGGVRVGGGVVGGGSRFGVRGGRVELEKIGDLEERRRRTGKGVFVKGGGRARERKGKGARRGAQNVSRGRRFQEFFVS
jgi:hypothetical protein